MGSEQSLANYRQTVLAGLAQVADTLDALTHDAQAVEAQSEARTAAAGALRLIQVDYEAGTPTTSRCSSPMPNTTRRSSGTSRRWPSACRTRSACSLRWVGADGTIRASCAPLGRSGVHSGCAKEN